MAIPLLTVTPQSAAQAYRATEAGAPALGGGGTSFGDTLSRAIAGVVDSSQAAEGQAVKAIAGAGNLTEVATAVAKAELALQTTTALRDKVVAAYQEIMRMPI
jgi:flagellar hook-basal body complex protein FliE